MRCFVRITPLTLLLVLSACAGASRDCDPTTGGLFGAIGCDSSGRYDARLAVRQNQQAGLMQRKATLIEEQGKLEAEHDALKRDLVAAEAERDKAARELAAMRAKLKSGQSTNRNLKAEVATLERTLAQSKAEVDELQMAEKRRAARLAELEREQDNLTEEYEAGRR